MKDENVLKDPRKPIQSNNNILLSVRFEATKIPKKNDAMKLIKEVF